ncbi:MAG: GatB/YqeY domain-containing protein [Bacteroidia bacterium]|nr:GatB/YqeY domain-containing protein [Bacteroidia bacterium]MBP7260110.1 GatB/YqeY domain-containing protein [Bacteroidia bacterium]MBP9179501.1 GatB/YqeY domain-containing protein [Bacteroidia bacterium]MBP9723737.1 GatB/YqeY domain-containing protein [Bacteroidia bacterium]
MTLAEQINEDIKTAMKARDEASLRALRALKSALLLAATAEGAGDKVEDEQAIKIFQKLAKQRKESMDIYLQNGRDELAQKEKEEIDVIERYLPQQMSEAEIKTILQQVVADAGATTSADFGKVMPLAMKALAGKADGKIISTLLKSLLN